MKVSKVQCSIPNIL